MDPISATVGEPTNPQGSQPASPTDSEIVASLEKVLGSDQFVGAARQQRLLRHLVSKHLARATSDLKEYTLGVEVFDRGDDFDPRLDPIVRVEASRLRSRLQKYYDGPGRDDKLRISLPRGAYLPSFTEAPAVLPPATPSVATEKIGSPAPVFSPAPGASAPSSTTRKRPFVLYGLIAALALACVCLLYFRRSSHSRSAAVSFSHFRRLTTGEVSLSAYPSFSPDGSFLVYARREGGKWSLYERDLHNLALTNLTPDVSSGDCYQPSWSPDGNSIAFRSDRETGHGLFLMDARKRTVAQITDGGYYPSWSPDSRALVFSTANFTDPVERAGNGQGTLSMVDVQTKTVTEIRNAAGIESAMQPAWSPDGRRIAFWGSEQNGDRDIWSIPVPPVDQKDYVPEPVNLLHDAWTDWSPAWAPDGKYLYFSSDRGGSMNLWRIPVDLGTGEPGGAPDPVTTPSSYSGWMSFAPNGKEFAYVHRTALGELFKAPFTADKGLDLDHAVQLTTGERDLHEPEISPDGRSILVRVQDPQEDLALLNLDGTVLRRLTNDRFSDRNAHWFPDRKQIVFSSNRGGSMQLWTIGSDGSNMRQITKNGIFPTVFAPNGTLLGFPPEQQPIVLLPSGAPLPHLGLPPMFRPVRWSPDSRYVVGRMNAQDFGSGSMFIYTPGNSDFWQIASVANSPTAIWLQNGVELLFSREDGIFVADVRSHQIRPAIPPAHNAEMRSRFTLSHDNGTAYYVVSDDEEDIWLGS